MICIGSIYCNACNRVNSMIFVYALVLTILVTMYSLWDFCLLPEWLPNWFRSCTLMGFVLATEGAFRPQLYFIPYGLTHNLRASHTIKTV